MEKEQNSFPLYIKFFEPKDYLFKYKVEFKPFVSTSDNFDISSMKKIEEAKPNIYFFVVETLRNDMINEDTMPNLTKFRADCTFTNGIANANATHHAWFSILNSVYPIYWNEYRERSSKLGSLPLRILKNNDYKINVFSSAHLDYFDYIHTIFGSKPIYDYFYENQRRETGRCPVRRPRSGSPPPPKPLPLPNSARSSGRSVRCSGRSGCSRSAARGSPRQFRRPHRPPRSTRP